MKLFTKDIDKKLFEQYQFGNDLEKQKVVAKIFNPYGRGTFYLLNSDVNDPDYIWAIIDLFEVEIGSISRNELETMKVPPFRLGLERDMYFEPVNAAELYRGLLSGKHYDKGGETDEDIVKSNSLMVLSQIKEIKHHADEVSNLVTVDSNIEAWVVGKIERASTDLSDITHYLDGKSSYMPNDKFEHGGEMEEDRFMSTKAMLNYSTENGINYYIFWVGKKAIVQAKIEDEDVYIIDKHDLREMSESARIMGIDTVELRTNYGIELKSTEKPQTVGFDKIVKLQDTYADGGELTVSPTEKANSLKGQQKLKF